MRGCGDTIVKRFEDDHEARRVERFEKVMIRSRPERVSNFGRRLGTAEDYPGQRVAARKFLEFRKGLGSSATGQLVIEENGAG